MPDIEKMVSALEGKKVTGGVLWDSKKECGCAIGHLLIEAGVDKKDLDRQASIRPFQDVLREHYGLTWAQSWAIMSHNDSMIRTSHARRRDRVISWLNNTFRKTIA